MVSVNGKPLAVPVVLIATSLLGLNPIAVVAVIGALVPDPAALDDISYAAGEHVLQASQQLLEQAGIPYATAVATGDPVHALVDLIEEQGCELVVMGSRSSGAFLSALQGSVSQSLAHASPVPVLLVKPPAELVAPRDLPEDLT